MQSPTCAGWKSVSIVTSCFLFDPNHFMGVIVQVSRTSYQSIVIFHFALFLDICVQVCTNLGQVIKWPDGDA